MAADGELRSVAVARRSSGQGRGRAVGALHPGGDDPVGDGRDLVVGQPAAAVGRDHVDHREDPAGQVGAAGGRVVVGGVVERLDDGRDAPVGVEVVAVELLERAAGEQRAGADRVEGRLLVAAAGDVVAEDPALARRRGRSRRRAARRPGPASPARGWRGSGRRAGWPCRPSTASCPRSSRSARARSGTAGPSRRRGRRCRRCRRTENSSAGKTFSMSRWAMMLPIVARRSPAMTTPPGKVAATIVVPCGARSPASPGGHARGATAAGRAPARRGSRRSSTCPGVM